MLITVVPNESKVMRPPRAIHPLGHQLGRVLGTAGDVELQQKTLFAALKHLTELHPPGNIVDMQIAGAPPA